MHANAGKFGRKPWEVTPYRPHISFRDVLLVGPARCGEGKGKKIIWFTCKVRAQWCCRVAQLLPQLWERGLLVNYNVHDLIEFHTYITHIPGGNKAWVSEMRDIRDQKNLDLASVLPVEVLPSSSLLWPYLRTNVDQGKRLLGVLGYL
jgi:hypothetical protein